MGVDYHLVGNRLAIGGDIWVYKPFPTQLCTQVDDGPRSCHDEGIAHEFGVSIAVGFTAVWFLSL